MIDTHSHVLFGVDDGAQTIEESIEMLKVAQADGLTKVITTSHSVPGIKFENDAEHLNDIYEQVEVEMKKQDIKVELILGSEIMLTPLSLEWLRDHKAQTINNTSWVLVEIPWNKNLLFDIDEDKALTMVKEMGYRVLIAHPERYPQVQDDYTKLAQWKALGYDFQVNRSSLLDTTREIIHDLAWRMLDDGYCDVIGSDAHRYTGLRVNKLKDIYDILAERYGIDEAKRLIHDNPQRLIDGLDLIQHNDKSKENNVNNS
jgi:protein-tyrosine phosphatase